MLRIRGIEKEMTFATANRWEMINSPMPLCKAYKRIILDGYLTVFVGQEPSGPDDDFKWHLSISHKTNQHEPGRIPTWEEIKEARYLFCPNHVYMAMILPPMKEFVNVHRTTMHLHEVPKG